MKRHNSSMAMAVLAGIFILEIVPTSRVNALETEWTFLRPSNTGIPGEEVRFARIDPTGRLWVSARYPFYGEGGVACTADLVHWTTYANWETPLPDDIVQSILFDDDGSTWFGTPAGLSHLKDGLWTNYNSTNSPLPGSAIGPMTRDSQGRLWLLYASGVLNEGVAMFDGTNWAFHPKSTMGFAPTMLLTSIAVDADDTVWVGTEQAGGIGRFDGSEWTVLDASGGYSDGPARLLTTDDAGDLWVDWYQGIMEFDGESWIDHPDPPLGGQLSTLNVVTPSLYYAGTYSGLVQKYDGSWQSWTYGASGSYVLSIDFDELGYTWVGGLNRVRRLDEETGTWKTYNEFNTGLPTYFITSFAAHPDGSMYIGTEQGGMAKFEGDPNDLANARWRCFNADNDGFEPWPFNYDTPYGTDTAQDVLTGPDGSVWVAANGLGRWNGTQFDRWTIDDSNIRGHSLQHLGHDGNQTLWIGYPYIGGADSFDGLTFDHWSWAEDNLPGDDVYDFGTDPAGNMWIVANGVLGFFDGVEWTRDPIPGVPGIALKVEVAPNGDVWVGTDSGVLRWNDTTSTLFTLANSDIPANEINDILITPEGIVWVAAFQGLNWPYFGGIARFDGSTWTKFNRQNSPIPHEQVIDLGLDAMGRLWIGTGAEGVAVLRVADPAAVELVIAGEALPIMVSPNPLRQGGRVEFTLARAGMVSGHLFDTAGRLVRSVEPAVMTGGPQTLPLDTAGLAAGIYHLKLRTPNGDGHSRLVIVR